MEKPSKWMNRCKPKKIDTKQYGKMIKRILILEEERVCAKNARGWNIEKQKRRVTDKEYKRVRGEFEVGGFMTQQGLWNIIEKRMLEDRGVPPKK